MARRIARPDAAQVLLDYSGGCKKTVVLQVIGNGVVFFSTQRQDLDAGPSSGGNPGGGFAIQGPISQPPLVLKDFSGVLYHRSSAVNVEVEASEFGI